MRRVIQSSTKFEKLFIDLNTLFERFHNIDSWTSPTWNKKENSLSAIQWEKKIFKLLSIVGKENLLCQGQITRSFSLNEHETLRSKRNFIYHFASQEFILPDFFYLIFTRTLGYLSYVFCRILPNNAWKCVTKIFAGMVFVCEPHLERRQKRSFCTAYVVCGLNIILPLRV